MKNIPAGCLMTCLAATFIVVSPVSSHAAPITFSSAGSSAASIQAQVDLFRSAIGNPNNGNAPGPLLSGRREINWDGGGATVAAPAPTPFAGFQTTRGALFTTPGTGFLQTPVDAPEFTAINPSYATTFEFFSPIRIFTALGSNIIDTTFTLPGSPSTPAFVSAFGVVFSDVDLANTTTLQFFDRNNSSLGIFAAPIFNNGLSFLGINFNAGEQVTRVRITSGNSALGPTDTPNTDVVVTDDFIYSEPRVVPEPTSMLLFGTGLTAFAVVLKKRR